MKMRSRIMAMLFALFVPVGCFSSPSTYTVKVEQLLCAHGKGSFVIVAPGWGITAKHVANPLQAKGIGKVLRVIKHPKLDLALVHVAELKGSVKFSISMPKFGQKLHAVGFHMGHTKLWTDGRAGRLGIMSCQVMPGCSGGAVVWRGRLVGIIRNVYTVNVRDRLMGLKGPFVTYVPHMAGYTPLTKDVVKWIHEQTR